MFKIDCAKAKAEVLCKERLTSGAAQVFEVEFTFNTDWDGLSRAAVFETDGYDSERFEIVLDSENKCTIPWEVLKEYGVTLKVGVYGSDSTGTVILPTIYATLGVVERGAEHGNNVQPPTADVVAQILSTANEAKETANSVRQDADDGLFNGKSTRADLIVSDTEYTLTVQNDGEETQSVTVPIAGGGGEGGVIKGVTADFRITSGILALNKVDVAEQDNTRPITSSGVYTLVGNIDALLSQI